MFSWFVNLSCWWENQHQPSSDRIWLDYGLCQINIRARASICQKVDRQSLTKSGLSQNFSRKDLAWTGLYLIAYRSRVGLDRLKWPFSQTSLGRVLDKNQPGSQLEFLNNLLFVNCQYFFFLCPMCVLYQCPIPQTRPSWEHWLIVTEWQSHEFTIRSVFSAGPGLGYGTLALYYSRHSPLIRSILYEGRSPEYNIAGLFGTLVLYSWHWFCYTAWSTCSVNKQTNTALYEIFLWDIGFVTLLQAHV